MTAAVSPATGAPNDIASTAAHRKATLSRLFGWMMLGMLAAFLLNVYLTFWQNLPGVVPLLGGRPNGAADATLTYVQLAIVVLGLIAGAAYVLRTDHSLRDDAKRVSDFNAYLIRGAFWAVLLVGVADTLISFLRVEGLLPALIGNDLTFALGRSNYRGPYVHMPLVALAFVIAAVTRSLGFFWLALLVVAAELLIVIGRFIFSYEQAFLSDLVRFWYAALFLFASAYTLLEEGHVRVDVAYAGMSPRWKGIMNATGTLLFGIPLCWVILNIGMESRQSIIISPMVSYEVTQAGFGLYVKYLMAAFLGVFAVTMLVQFISFFFDAVADVRGDPGGRDHNAHTIQ